MEGAHGQITSRSTGFHAPTSNKSGVGGFSARKDQCLRGIEYIFLHAGGFIFDHALWFIFASIVVVVLCSLSFFFIQFETRADLLYALPTSRARSDLAKLTTLFGTPPRVNMVFVVSAYNHSILTPQVLRKLKKLDDYIKYNLTAVTRFDVSERHNGYKYGDVCHRMLLRDGIFTSIASASEQENKETPCYSLSPLDLYNSEQHFGKPVATRSWPYIPNVAANKIIKADLTLTDPDIVRLPSGTVRLFNATGFLCLYHTSSASEEALHLSLQWEKALVNFINKRIKPFAHKAKYTVVDKHPGAAQMRNEYDNYQDDDWQDYQVFVNAQRSWQDELGRATSFDKRLMLDYGMAYLIIATYMIFANRTNNLVRSKAFCGFIGSLSALFGFALGGGFCYWLGLRHTPTMHASPFLVLGIGLDNTFVVLNFYTLAHPYTKRPRERCQMALCEAGLSITNTTFTSIISFLVGAAGPYLAVRNFCLITAMGLLGGYLMNIVFAFPFLCLEAVAESEGRIWPWPSWMYQYIPSPLLPLETKEWLRIKESRNHSQDPFERASIGTFEHPGLECQHLTKPNTTPSTSPLSISRVHPNAACAINWRLSSHTAGSCEPTSQPTEFQPQPGYCGETTYNENGSHTENGSNVFENSQTDGSLAHRMGSENLSLGAIETYLRKNLYGKNPSIQEIASIQWTFEKRRQEFQRACHRRRKAGTRTESDRIPEDTLYESSAALLLEGNPETLSDHTLKRFEQIASTCCLVTTEPKGNVGSGSRGIFLRRLGPILNKYWMQLLLLSLMLTYIVVSLFGALVYLEAGLNLENLTPPDSYLREAFHLSRDKFPIFPYSTDVFFTAPKNLPHTVETLEERRAVMKAFTFDSYGTRNPHKVKALAHAHDESAHAGIATEVEAAEVSRYWNSLGEIPWWEPETYYALQQMDVKLRSMLNTQDLLNGMLLFFNENANKIFIEGTTSEERRVIFHTELYRWLRSGVIGRHVRDQFRFDSPDPNDPAGMPRLMGYRLVCFNFNFLNSLEQSQYMLDVRSVCKGFTSNWNEILLNASDHNHIEGLQYIKEYSGGQLGSSQEISAPKYEKPSMKMDAGSSSWFSVTPFMETFIFFESDVTILKSTIINMATAFVAIVLVSSLLMRGFATAFLVTLIICCVDLGIFGFMGFWSIHLNILSMILLVLSIGFSVDYTVHVVHTFTHCPGIRRKDKTVETLILMCNPVTHGALSTMLGICPVGLRREFIMETFFKMTLLVVSFGFINGVIFLPVVLAIRGPKIGKIEKKGAQLQKHLHSVIEPLVQISRSLDDGDGVLTVVPSTEEGGEHTESHPSM